MNAESSDWKRFIPVSDELKEIYKELDDIQHFEKADTENVILPPSDQRHYEIASTSLTQATAGHLEEQLKVLIQRYDSTISNTEVILDSVSSSLDSLGNISKQYDQVSNVMTTLHDECEGYVSEEKTLTRVLNELQEPLSYFRDLTVITDKIGMDSAYSSDNNTQKSMELEYDLYSNELTDVITRIFDCIRFFRSHPSYKDSENYLNKFIALLNRVYSIVRSKFSSLLQTCEGQIMEKPEKLQLLMTSYPLYYYMSALSSSNKALVGHILQIHEGTVNELTGTSCFELYMASRERLVKPLLTNEIEGIIANVDESLDSRFRKSILLLIEVCELESTQYLSFFHGDNDHQEISVQTSPTFINSISSLIENLALVMYELLHPLVLDVRQLEQLCDLVQMLKLEIITGNVLKRNKFVSVVIPIVVKLEEDIRERVLFLAHEYITTTIQNYAPTKEDLNYPDKLYQYYAQKRNKDFSVYSTWYTPVQKVLRVLSLLYTCIDYSIMADITVEAVTAVLNTIQKATSMLVPIAGVVDSELFRIKTLLILREQISPFDLHSTGTYLPFSDTSLRENALYRLFRRAIPTISFINQDGLKLIEDQLKQSTNSLIESICREVCDGVITLIQQYEQFMSQVSSPDEKFPLMEEQIVNMVSEYTDGVDHLEDIVGKIALYIDSPATQGILFAPIRRMLINNTDHLKEILVHLKPNNFPRYLEDLTKLENKVNAIDATKFSHERRKQIVKEEVENDEHVVEEGKEEVDENEKNETQQVEEEEVKEEIKEETKEEVKEEIDEEVKQEEVKQEIKEEIKEEPKEEIINEEVKEESTEEIKEEPKESNPELVEELHPLEEQPNESVEHSTEEMNSQNE